MFDAIKAWFEAQLFTVGYATGCFLAVSTCLAVALICYIGEKFKKDVFEELRESWIDKAVTSVDLLLNHILEKTKYSFGSKMVPEQGAT